MATSSVQKVQLKLEFDNGMSDEGKQKYKSRTLSNIRHEASDDNLLQASNAINALTSKEVLRTSKIVTTEITA